MIVKPLVAILVVAGKNVLAEVRKSTDNFGAGATWIPGGHVEEGETEEHAFFRETSEELGIKPTNYYSLCKTPWEKEKKHYTIQYYVCDKWNGKIQNKEASKLVWIPSNDIQKLDEQVDRDAFKKYLEKI